MAQLTSDRDGEMVRRLAAWKNSSNDAAVGTSLRKAADVLQALAGVRWALVDTAAKLTGEQRSAVEGVLKKLREGLEADEHAVALAPHLQGVENDAMRLIDASVRATQAQTPSSVPPPATPAPPLQNADQVPVRVETATTGAKAVVRDTRKVTTRELDGVLNEIRASAKRLKNPKIQLSWEITEE